MSTDKKYSMTFPPTYNLNCWKHAFDMEIFLEYAVFYNTIHASTSKSNQILAGVIRIFFRKPESIVPKKSFHLIFPTSPAIIRY